MPFLPSFSVITPGTFAPSLADIVARKKAVTAPLLGRGLTTHREGRTAGRAQGVGTLGPTLPRHEDCCTFLTFICSTSHYKLQHKEYSLCALYMELLEKALPPLDKTYSAVVQRPIVLTPKHRTLHGSLHPIHTRTVNDKHHNIILLKHPVVSHHGIGQF
jgi:hypothetical protein